MSTKESWKSPTRVSSKWYIINVMQAFHCIQIEQDKKNVKKLQNYTPRRIPQINKPNQKIALK